MASDDATYHHGNLREALLETTTAIVRDEGLDEVSMRSLSDRLNVSRSAAYRHFDGKTDLLAEVARRGFLELRENLRPIRTGEDGGKSAGERLLEMGRAYVGFAVDNPAHYRLMFQWDWSADEFEDLRTDGRETYEELLKIIESGQESGEFRTGNPGEMAFSTWALVHGIAMLTLDGHDQGMSGDTDQLESILSWIGTGLLDG